MLKNRILTSFLFLGICASSLVAQPESINLAIQSAHEMVSIDKAKIKTALLVPGKTTQTFKELSPVLEKWAERQYEELNHSIFFDRSFIVDAPRVRDRHLKYKHDKKNLGKKVTTKTEDGLIISCTYFNRGSDKLLVVGEGFTNEREVMTPFLGLFDYDIMFFDFRGQGYKPEKNKYPWLLGSALVSYFILDYLTQNKIDAKRKMVCSAISALAITTFGLNPANWSGRLAEKTFGVNSNELTLGEKEELDVISVVKTAKKIKEQATGKEYKEVYGLGICYGAFIFAKTEALYPHTFDKLILDGCWHDLPSVIAKLKKDMRMLSNPQRGGWSNTWPFSEPWCQDTTHFLARNVWGIKFDTDISLDTYLPMIKNTPVLFFHGKDDLMIPLAPFADIWEKIGTPQKAAIITSNEHVINHLKQKQLYKVISELFLGHDYQTFVSLMQNIDEQMPTIKNYLDVCRHGEK